MNEFSLGDIHSFVETGKELDNRILFFKRRIRDLDVGELRKFQIPRVGSQPLRELLECLYKPPMFECESPKPRVLTCFRIDDSICWANNASPRGRATRPLPHPHRIVDDIAYDDTLVVAFVLAGTVFLLGIRLSLYAEIDCHGKQFIRSSATFRTLFKYVAYLDRLPFGPTLSSLARDTQLALKYGTPYASFMLLEVS